MLQIEYPFTPRLCILRHSRTSLAGGDEERALSPDGEKLAQDKKEELKATFSFDLVISSSASRCQQTAAILAPHTKTLIWPELYTLLDEAFSLLFTWNALSSCPDSFSEPIENLRKRLHQTFKTTPQAKDILIVAHSGVINILGILLAKQHFKQFLGLRFAPCCGFILKPVIQNLKGPNSSSS